MTAKPSPLDIEALLAFHRAQHGDAVMMTSPAQTTDPSTGTPTFTLAPGQVPPATPTDTPVIQPGQTFTAEQIEAARRQEKEKLYPQLQAVQEQLAAIQRERDEERTRAEKAEADRAAFEAAQQKAKDEAEMSAKELIESRQREWEDRFAELEAQRSAEQALFQKEREAQQIIDYRNQQIAQHEEDLMPELRDLVAFGPTPQDIDASIALLVERTARIVEQTRAAALGQRAAMPGVGVTQPPVGPLEMNSEQNQFSAEQIRDMDMATYLKNRDKLIGSSAAGRSNRGLF